MNRYLTNNTTLQVPLVFYYGHATPGDAPELYRYLVDRMASVLDRRAEASPEVGGRVTPGATGDNWAAARQPLCPCRLQRQQLGTFAMEPAA